MRHSEETHWRKSEAKKKQRNTQETIIFVKWRNQQICRSCWRKNWAQTTLDAKTASHYNLQVKGCENVDLTGFKAFDFSEGVPYFSVTKNGLTFSKAVTLKLGCPSYVRLLINSETKQVVLQVCSENTPRSVSFYKEKGNDIFSVRWNSRDLIATFERLLGTTFENHGFRVEGALVDEQMMLFDLNFAKPLV